MATTESLPMALRNPSVFYANAAVSTLAFGQVFPPPTTIGFYRPQILELRYRHE